MKKEIDQIESSPAILWLLAVGFAVEKQKAREKIPTQRLRFQTADECFAELERIGAFDEMRILS